MSKTPKQPHEKRLACPDCGKATPERQLRVEYLAQFGQFIECPHCYVGSPVPQWRRKP